MKKFRIAFFILLCLAALASILFLIKGSTFAVLDPKGLIGMKQRQLIIIATLLMLIVVIPVLILTVVFVTKYRADKKAKYTPDHDHNNVAEMIWWGFPFLIVIGLSILAWKSSYELDPFKPLDSSVKPLKIQVVALQWKWLFIYPDYNIATVNFLQFPEQTPLDFEITADAPMNSFWIPQIGGQVYAMPGMNTQLHLIANEKGDYRGSSANLSGEGFSGMTFMAKATDEAEFMTWLKSVQQSPDLLTLDEYQKLAEPSQYNPPASYVLKAEDLYERIVMKYMEH